MKTHLQIWALTLFFLIPTSELCKAQSQVERLNLVVSNVCDFYGQYVVSNGPASSSVTPTLGNAGCVFSSSYVTYDTLQVTGDIKYLEVTDDSPNPDRQKLFYTASADKIFSFYGSFPTSFCDPVIMPRDTFLVDSISGLAANVNRLFVIREASTTNNFLVYDTLSTTPVNAMNLAMTPKLIETYYSLIAVVGIGANNETLLKIFNSNTLALVKDTVFGSMADNPISIFFQSNQMLYLASQPGDSVVNMTKYNIAGQSMTSATMYSGSGTLAYCWDGYYFHFQPEFDQSGNNYDFQVFKYDPFAMQQYALFNLNIKFHKLLFAGTGGFGYYPYIHAVPASAINNMVKIYAPINYTEVDSFQAIYQVDLIASDFRCPISVEEYDDSKVKILAFPNPTSNSITINASGLIRGRDYKMDIVDMSGKIWYEKTIHAKMSVEIPLETMPSGIYILRIHTLKGIVSEKIVKE